jgi:zinc protease
MWVISKSDMPGPDPQTEEKMRGKTVILGLFAALLLLALPSVTAARQQSGEDEFNIPYKKFVLNNGLTLLVHEDHKAPIVAVNIWYHVGSKNEKPGKTGFAHLFEHLMFNGSENAPGDYFKYMELIGVTGINGTTNNDRTNYFQNVPTTAQDTALWMESDRMGHLLGAITQAVLDEQRGVVQNEKRQGENQPYGKSFSLIAENTYPQGHPYSWSVIGAMEDLGAASMEDVQEWFKTYYGPNNAVLSIAGDIDTETVKAKVEGYFGDIPPGPPIQKHDVWISKRTGTHRMVMQDRVPQARIYMVWNVPEWGDLQANHISLISSILTSGKNSRLYKRLVYDEQIATRVSSFAFLKEIGGQLYIMADARPGVPLAEVEKAINEELAALLADGPTDKEIEREKVQYKAGFIRGIERIGGFGGKSDVLASGEIYGGHPEAYKKNLKDILGATAEDLKKTADEWLSDGVFILEVQPFPDYKAAAEGADRSKVPEAGAPPETKFPDLQRATLSNGLKIVLAERHEIPVVLLDLVLDAGYAADQLARPGTASLAMNMLDEGTATRSALQISEELELLGAQLNTGSDLDASFVMLNALKENLEGSLVLMADVVLNPSFPGDEFDRLVKQRLAQIMQEKASPMGVGMRVVPKLIYGEGHAYSNPLTGSGTLESVKAMTRDDLVKFHQTWFKPNAATMIVVGDTTLDEIVPKLEKLFGGWAGGDVPAKNIGAVANPDKPVIYLIDRPGAPQSVVFSAQIVPPKANPNENTIQLINDVLGGGFTSRINMNIREEKHWSYGARTILQDTKGPRICAAMAPVQGDKTKETVFEIHKEFADFIGAEPATPEELNKTKISNTLTLPGRWETAGAVLNSVAEIVQYGLPDDFYQGYADDIRAITLEQMHEVAENLLKPENLVWLVVGDRAKVEGPLKELGYGEVIPLDADGNVIK